MNGMQVKEQAIKYIYSEIKSLLNLVDIDKEENLVEKGLSSIQIMKIISGIRKFGLKVTFADFMKIPIFKNWQKLIENAEMRGRKKSENTITYAMDKDNKYKEFPLTDVQYSYLIGRQDDQILGGVGCHAYLEIDGKNIDVNKLQLAWNKIQYANPMLRAKFNNNGTQQIMKEPYSEKINIYDLVKLQEKEIKRTLENIRSELSHRKLMVQKGEVAGLSVAILPDDKTRIFLDVDLLVVDVMSLSILIDDLSKVYNDEIDVKESEYTFRNYVLDRNKDKEFYNKDKEYWQNKISVLPNEAPALPLKTKPEIVEKTIFSRRKKIFDKMLWDKVKAKASKYKVTPSMVLLTSYSMVIERWTNQENFFINIPLFNRDSSNEELNKIIADFSDILLVECEAKKDETIIEKIKKVSKTFLENVSHSSYSGVKVQRDIFKSVGKNINVAPIVFACNIDYPLETEKSRDILGEITYMISQTPQVWLDFQTYINDGNLILCWDVVDELYPIGMIDDMFSTFYDLLKFLADNENWNVIYDALSKNQKKIRNKELDDILPLTYPEKTLYTEFMKMVEINPKKTAIIDGETDIKITYEELYRESLKLAGGFIAEGISKGDYVGIILPRGYKQIIGLLGILFAGAAYVPIGINQPKNRRNKIYTQIGIKYIVSNKETINKLCLSEDNLNVIDMDSIQNTKRIKMPIKVNFYDTAYIIMTSGTTGIPKGVEIAHNSVMNTIDDINERYQVNSKDVLIMVSAIDFDLSVYDIFGMLSVGATVVTLNDDNFKDPDLWIELIEKYNVTLWNSVPILFDMLVTMAEGKNIVLPLKTVLLSGDWIATTLPGRFYSISKDSLVVGMGGGTEASIWSNFINVPKQIPKGWVSIPYGKALKNQVYRVVDELGRICPNYVRGELLIGGVGVAKGYKGDKELTDKKFIEMDGIKWYKTGDTGLTWSDGTIEFLGRADNQVKVKGHRIELGEIQDTLLKYPKISKAVAEVIKVGTNNQLVAFIETVKDKNQVFEINQNLINKILNTEITYEFYNDYLNKQNKTVILQILDIFNDLAIRKKEFYTIEEIMETGLIKEEFKELIVRWISLLGRYGYVKIQDKRYRFIHTKESITEVKEDYINLLKDKIIDILKGKETAINVFYSEEFKLSPTDFLRKLKNYQENISRIVETIGYILDKKDKKINILEIGGRDCNLPKEIFRTVGDKINRYIYLDNSMYFRNEFKEIENKFDVFEYLSFNFEDGVSKKFGNDKFDIIIFYNSIHRFKDIQVKLKDINTILNHNGFIVGSEVSEDLLLAEISAAVLEKGFNNFHLLNRNNKIIPGIDVISNIINTSNYQEVYISSPKEVKYTGNLLFVAKSCKTIISSEELTEFLKCRLPEYMVPFRIIEIEHMPLNKNGKVNRRELKNLVENTDYKNIVQKNKILKEVSDETTRILINIWKEILGKNEVLPNSNYFYLGGDSLVATRLVAKIKELFKIDISIGDLFSHPILNDLVIFIKNSKKNDVSQREKIVKTNHKNENDPFNLTDVQFAYWIGRKGTYSLGNVATHCYFELDCKDIEVNKLQKNINDMIKDYPMLRTIILNSGKQQVVKNVPPYILSINDMSYFSKREQKEALKTIRNAMSHEVLKTDQWPLFNFQASILTKDKIRLHISFDNIILDGWSMFHILRELKQRYDDVNFKLEKSKVSFRDYVLYIEQLKNTSKYSEDKKYWLDRLDKFLEAPKFEFTKSESEVRNQNFVRRERYIEADKWKKIKEIAKQNSLTPTIMLITVFCETIRKYSVNKEFVLNLTQFNRDQIHPDINKIVGDFTTLTFLEVKNIKEKTLINRAKKLQKQLSEDMEHSLYSAVEFGRELRIKHNNQKESLMPIVFTSGLGLSQNDNWIGELIYSISQTPQVWLDHQVVEDNGRLKLMWDSLDEIFAENLLDDMFRDYIESLNNISNNYNIIDNVKNYTEGKEKNEEIINENNICTIKNKDSSEYIYQKLIDKLTDIWKDILKVKSITIYENFFALGGNSLNMIQLSNRLMEEFDYHLSLEEFMEEPYIKILAKKMGQWISMSDTL